MGQLRKRTARSSQASALVGLLALVLACAPAVRSTLGHVPTAADLAPLWVAPESDRDTFYGPGGARLAPRPDVVYTLVERKTGGFSPKLEVRAPDGVKWSVKLGAEAQSEVTSSRIVWAVGYHQPPAYYLRNWQIDDGTGVHQMGPGRFRPHLEQFKSRGSWSWHENPFADSVQFRGLLVLMMILNSTDLKDVNNEVYRVRLPGAKAVDWFTVKDLGASLGETGRIAPRRNDIDMFEKQRFITGVEEGHVRFEFHGRHQELLRALSPSDVRWICERLRRLSSRQWQDAFRAGGYDATVTQRYLRKLDEKIDQGLGLEKGGS